MSMGWQGIIQGGSCSSCPALPLAPSAALTAGTWPSCSLSPPGWMELGTLPAWEHSGALMGQLSTCCWDNVSLGVGMTCPGREQR